MLNLIYTDVGTVTLEALCSSDRAGVRWTANDVPQPPDLWGIEDIDLSYSCINSHVSCYIYTHTAVIIISSQ